MTQLKDPWFVAQRSEVMVKLLLDSRDDIQVRSAEENEYGYDIIIELKPTNPAAPKLFVAQVKGTTDIHSELWKESVKALFSRTKGLLYFPTCLFVVDVGKNIVAYSWIAEPFLEGESAILRFDENRPLQQLTEEALDGIIHQVADYYSVVPKFLLR